MTKSLKGSNNISLGSVLIANLAAYYALIQGDAIVGLNFIALLNNWQQILPAGFTLTLVGIVNAQLSANAKARIVFTRWNDPLPGCRVFTELIKTDSRISTSKLKKAVGTFPTSPSKQNALWYSLYKSIESEPAVEQVHKSFLFTRDYACLSLFMIVIFGIVGWFQIISTKAYLIYLGVLIGQFFFVCRAARIHGNRFVTTVLARKSVGVEGGTNE